MDQKTLNEFKEALEARKKEVLSQLGNISTKDKGSEDDFTADFPQYGDSMEDSVGEVADYIKNLSVEKELEKELHSTEAALKRIEDGTYGVCAYCGNEIEIERLKIRPASNSCVTCKTNLKANK